MQAYLLGFGAPTSSIDLFLLLPKSRVSFNNHNTSPHYLHPHLRPPSPSDGRSRKSIFASAAVNRDQDHYAVLGLSSTASSIDIKRAYRLLARKYHPDVCKDSKSGKVFKSIRLAYDVLSNEETRAQYDSALRFQEDPWSRNWTYDSDFEKGRIIYRWEELRRQAKREKYWQQYEAKENSDDSDANEEEFPDAERGSFSEVLMSVLCTVFLVKIVGYQLYLLFHSLIALFDRKLDSGYKMGYFIACLLGGRSGFLLTLGISFASWCFGKTSSSLVSLVILAMWVGTNLSRCAPIPQGALITLIYMSFKLQNDLK